MSCSHAPGLEWCTQCLQMQEAEANEFRREQIASLTARVEELEEHLKASLILVYKHVSTADLRGDDATAYVIASRALHGDGDV